jgi:hypothetical protein
MTDLPSSLGIEAVECVADGGRSVTVRVTGRWRRRRPELRGQPMLVVETETGRQRFLAMPEPPSLTGAAPGTWRMSFSVPVALAPALPGRTFLQLGGIMLPLPIGEVAIAGEVPEDSAGADGPGPDVLEERRARGSELAAESARRRAAELAGEVERLERELGEARTQADRRQAAIAEGDRRLRLADQHIHAERALRSELEHELAHRTRSAQHDLRALHERVADLERELTRMRRAVDEAGHLAAAAHAARVEAERRLAERAPPPPTPAAADSARAEQLRRELELDRSARGAPPILAPARPVERARDRVALGHESAASGQRTARDREGAERLAALERELAVAREEIEIQRGRSARAYEAIDLVRAELRQFREAALGPTAAPAPNASGDREPVTALSRRVEPVEAERLTEALARLRERTPVKEAETAQPPAPEPPLAGPPAPYRAAKAWLAQPFREIAGKDPTAAGRLLLALLPAQRAADPHAVAYDLVVSGVLCAQVTVGSGTVHVETTDAPRPLSEVDFRLVGDLAGVTRFLVAGHLRRRLPSRRRARVQGDRRLVAALDHLVRARLTLDELIAVGVKLDSLLALTLAASAIEPFRTAGERFTIAHRDPALGAPDAYLRVRDARPPVASTFPPHGPVSTVVVCPEDDLLGVLAGRDARVEGEERPLALLRQWLDRAQSG